MASFARNLYKTKLCKLFAGGHCPRAECSFAHGEGELRAPERGDWVPHRSDGRGSHNDRRDVIRELREDSRYESRRDYRDRGPDWGRDEDNRGRYDGGRSVGRHDEADHYRQGQRGGRFADNRPPKRKYNSSDQQSPWEDSELPPPRRKVSPGSSEDAKKQRHHSEEGAPIKQTTEKLRAHLKELEERLEQRTLRAAAMEAKAANAQQELESAQEEYTRLDTKAKRVVKAVQRLAQEKEDLHQLETKLRQYVELVHREEFQAPAAVADTVDQKAATAAEEIACGDKPSGEGSPSGRKPEHQQQPQRENRDRVNGNKARIPHQ
eukprot:CAMPEP_0118921486 /NCGR_PEP_ID=MMETSP1169-20130426/747_1 /TAXON_ID=36882 /ORGANISM="Pyramimonas obovata, Strain CCMP722" /LENGTH=321 /DNA_ID=CAMNT_0006862211 /DNA_START=214 /DNA_END=1180 /DNA_ORIENTATION=+